MKIFTFILMAIVLLYFGLSLYFTYICVVEVFNLSPWWLAPLFLVLWGFKVFLNELQKKVHKGELNIPMSFFRLKLLDIVILNICTFISAYYYFNFSVFISILLAFPLTGIIALPISVFYIF